MSSRSSASEALNAAFRLLAFRDRSETELKVKLAEKGFGEEEIAAAIGRCRELGYLDDARFARERARYLLSSGRAAGRRVVADLTARGIEETIAREALDAQISAGFSEDDLLRRLLQRRYPAFRFADSDERQRRRVVNFFVRRGFPLPRVLSILKEER